MTIEILHRVRCDPCERYLGHDKSAVSTTIGAALFLDFSSAYNEAVRRGWSSSPLICPECAAEWREKVLGEQVRTDGNP